MPRCSNCREDHRSNSKQCFYYKLEEEAIVIKYKEKLSYKKVKEKATDRFIIAGETCSSIVRKANDKTSTSRKSRGDEVLEETRRQTHVQAVDAGTKDQNIDRVEDGAAALHLEEIISN